MKRSKKLFLATLSVLLSIVFAPTVVSAVELDQEQTLRNCNMNSCNLIPDSDGIPSIPITITLLARQEIWSVTRQATGGSQVIGVMRPAHTVQSRVALGTNASPGATTAWQNHNAGTTTTRTHRSNAGRGVNIRAQFRGEASRSSSFTSQGQLETIELNIKQARNTSLACFVILKSS